VLLLKLKLIIPTTAAAESRYSHYLQEKYFYIYILYEYFSYGFIGGTYQISRYEMYSQVEQFSASNVAVYLPY